MRKYKVTAVNYQGLLVEEKKFFFKGSAERYADFMNSMTLPIIVHSVSGPPPVDR